MSTRVELRSIGRQVGGVWLPKTETHLADMMERGKRVKWIDGKLTYQHHKLEYAVSQCAPNRRRVALDIGGHVGLWSMWLVREFGTVHAFEPVPNHRALFLENVDMTRCHLHPVALGNCDGLIDIEIPDETTGNAHVAIGGKRHSGTRHVHNPDKQTVVKDVDIVRLDVWADIWASDNNDQPDFDIVDFIKIDVEGFEQMVIEGGEELIRRNKPIICVEQKGNEDNYGGERDAAAKLLQSWGAKPLKVIAGDWVFGW